MWGALAGALVGALAAWFFALDLARRSRAVALEDETARRAEADASTYQTQLAVMLALVVERLHALAAEIDAAARVPFVPGRDSGESAKAVGRARAAALAAADTARVHARRRDGAVFEVLRYAIERLPEGDKGADVALDLSLRLLEWDRVEAGGAEDAIVAVVGLVPSVAEDGLIPT